MRRTTLFLTVAAASAACVLAVATPATAHYGSANVKAEDGKTVLGRIWLSYDHKTGTVCDELADNVGVYGRFKVTGGNIYDVPDRDGAGNNCYDFAAPTGTVITQFEVVWRGGRTSGWQTA